MNQSFIRPLLCGAVLAVWTANANAQISGDASDGEDVFTANCGECHSVREGKDKRGPSLYGMYGAKAAQRPGFKYSDALLTSGLVWDAETLARYLTDPRGAVPGSKMKFDGLADAQERADVIAYMATLGLP
ncbi:MAG: c-type cytochrome [Azoarcus sp.]|jgi:cytochrome c|nr:c-type cytochrome [Azoarcus sp.]